LLNIGGNCLTEKKRVFLNCYSSFCPPSTIRHAAQAIPTDPIARQLAMHAGNHTGNRVGKKYTIYVYNIGLPILYA
jgi:hypothetical protein